LASEPPVAPDFSRLPPETVVLLRRLGAIAGERGTGVYLVGGLVRDLFLGVGNVDLDVCVAGDGPAFARRVADALGGTVVVHDRFLTAAVALPDRTLIDVATARTETYERAGALPRVTPGPIEADLRRRDFTINAMALRLDPEAFGALLDPFGGAADIAARKLRILHEKSFFDDPTRILRMSRFAARLGFKPEEGTRVRLAEALDARVFDFVSGDRVREEVFLGLNELEPAAVFATLADWGVLPVLLPGAEPGGDFAELEELATRAIALCEKGPTWDPSALRLLLLMRNADPGRLAAAGRRLNLSPSSRVVLESGPRLREIARAAEAAAKMSGVHRALRGLSLEVQLAALILIGPEKARERVFSYLRGGRGLQAGLTGDDLIAMGYPQGPALREMLEALVEARLDGETKTRRDEERWVRAHFPPSASG
jgi:tRNA nucleotidyltransferase (CCA-adding enzyme)